MIIGYRMLFALLGLSAIVTEIATLSDRGTFMPANFFSYFTIESNVIAVLVFVLSAVALANGTQNRLVVMLRGASTLNMIVVGVVFSLLLSGLDVDLTAVPWDNTVLHYIMPSIVALDWIIDAPKRMRITFRQGVTWMLFPSLYVLYSLVRGAMVGWYPYPFLNPITNGYTGVAVTIIAIAVGGLGLVWAITQFAQQTTKRPKN